MNVVPSAAEIGCCARWRRKMAHRRASRIFPKATRIESPSPPSSPMRDRIVIPIVYFRPKQVHATQESALIFDDCRFGIFQVHAKDSKHPPGKDRMSSPFSSRLGFCRSHGRRPGDRLLPSARARGQKGSWGIKVRFMRRTS